MQLRPLLAIALAAAGFVPAATLDFTHAAVVTPPGLTTSEKKAVQMLVEEVEKRSQVRWRVTGSAPGGAPAIFVGTEAELRGVLGPYAAALAAQPAPQGAEGFRLRAEASPAPAVLVVGNDARGVLFGVGKLLRTLRMEKGSVLLPGEVRVSTAPRYPIRGHQLGNRTLNNSVDAWTVPMWEQYFRDLAVFGANTVELLPPQANGNVDSPHSPLPLLEMMAEGSRLLNDYGLDVWIWFPALAKDYSDPATVEAELKNWTRVYQKLPRIDAVFVPGGDPGHTQPKYLMPFLEKQAQALRKFHPKAQMWVSPQGWDEQWLGEFYQALAAGPEWLNGVVHGPGVRVSLASLRASVPKRYRIRTYPDVTHTVRCSYPVPDWDPAWAMTLGREPINPRPVAQKKIFQGTGQGSAGFVTYSDGSNDDVNKMVWSSLGWDPEAPLAEILQDYGRYFIGNRYSNDFAQGLFALEQNWSGPLLAKTDIEITLQQFRSLEHSGAPGLLGNWRFQQALYRAYYDAYVRGRLLSETTLQAQAMEALEAAPRSGSLAAIGAAEKLLEESSVRPPFQSLRARVFELGAALYQSIGMQLSTELYGGYGKGRAATLDTVDAPLNDRIWLKSRFAAVRAMPKEEARLDEISTIVNWRNPGPGGFYDDLGNPGQQPHFVQNPGEDPPWIQPREDGPLSWASYAMSGRRAPVHMRYTGLDPEARYRVRVVYSGGLVSQEQGIRLLANGSIVVHPYLKKPQPVRPVEFDVPLEATRGGELTLDWDREATPSGRSRGAEVAEVWLMKK